MGSVIKISLQTTRIFLKPINHHSINNLATLTQLSNTIPALTQQCNIHQKRHNTAICLLTQTQPTNTVHITAISHMKVFSTNNGEQLYWPYIRRYTLASGISFVLSPFGPGGRPLSVLSYSAVINLYRPPNNS